jgi:hypothetical protein
MEREVGVTSEGGDCARRGALGLPQKEGRKMLKRKGQKKWREPKGVDVMWTGGVVEGEERLWEMERISWKVHA